MQNGKLDISDGRSVGAWIAPKLLGEFGAVTNHVPAGFEAYARIFHPAVNCNGQAVRWQAVAEQLGTTAHHEMQWHAILNMTSWDGVAPLVGEMHPEEFDVLCEIIAKVSGDTSQCYFGLCLIEGWLSSFSADELQPLLSLPLDRDYIVLNGPLSAINEIHREGSWRALPNLIWPADHSWLVASEVDFDSTLVGGSLELIQAIIDSPQLEAWLVEPTTSLAADADKINAGAK
jgi:hypothetical protein